MSIEYLELCQRIIDDGVWVVNERTGKRCKTVINVDLEYNCSGGRLPLLTTKKAYWKKAVAEMLGYIRGYSSASQFRAIGTDTWDANSNSEVWQKNPRCKGKDDMGRCYGVQGRGWRTYDFTLINEVPEIVPGIPIDQLKNIYDDLCRAYDDRSEIMTFLNVGERDRACLNACVWSHTFSVLEGTLYLTSYQRSDDLPLGHGFNQVQVAWFLMIMAQITGLKAGTAYHKIVNAHIYEDQYDTLINEQMGREPYKSPTLKINPDIKTLEDLETWVTLKDFSLHGYKHHPAIKYPFSV